MGIDQVRDRILRQRTTGQQMRQRAFYPAGICSAQIDAEDRFIDLLAAALGRLAEDFETWRRRDLAEDGLQYLVWDSGHARLHSRRPV